MVGGDQRRLRQGRTSELAAAFVTMAAVLGLIRIRNPRNDAKVAGQPVLIGEVIHVPDDAQQNGPGDVADALNAGQVFVTLQFGAFLGNR